ncbi:Succinate-semialdehyde dehydrogenase [Neofusicoccum parvum]|uniref:Succinate-semialdehyde dehydrogenase n=1 Tax=Neofusicoccum parvum TaxID=310453 RepID=A0ACB5SC71_9PEZI|nr:Succinate-semialdehyde dehydrogenase [Neofusicoccum parvum]GME59343.1 Succinate-semialdehyde dehydrogenase [Neofusicoccum parvum]
MPAPTLSDPSLLVQKAFIGGKWVNAQLGKTFEVQDPASGELIGTCPECDGADTNFAIEAAATAFPKWRVRTGRERSRLIRRWYDLVIENKDDITALITWENGKANPDAAGEVLFAASFLEWFSEEAARIYGDVIPHSAAGNRVSVLREPVGVCGMITPWNFPAGMMARKAAAALAAGCTCVIKTAGETPFTANALAVLAERAGIPAGVINIVTALENTPEIGLTLCESPVVSKISFTGSTRVGKLLMRQCSGTLKKLSLELGGNAPFIVFDDADLDTAVAGLIASKFKCTGQTCVCANRIFVQAGIHDAFVKRLVEVMGNFRVGSGFDKRVTHGPLIHSNAVGKVVEHVEDAKARGARVALGGNRLPAQGPNFFEPTVITGMSRDMKIAHEETFGPIAAIFRFETEEEVVKAANESEVGLAAYVFTQNLQLSHRITESLHVGMVGLNTGVISDAPSPFGGVKHSGLGREGSKYGLEEYTELKTVVTGGIHTTYPSKL